MPTSVRLDRKSEERLRRLARLAGKSKSALIREAIERLDRELNEAEERTVYEQLADSIGMVSLGPGDRARRSEELLRAHFQRKRKHKR
jgi:predicted DNA-binding protein